MKKYKKILLISGLILTTGSTAMAQKTAAAKINDPADKPASGITVFHYVAEKQRHYSVSNCIPGSDVELYTNPGGGSVAATAIADEKGEAHFLIDAETPVAFAINHSRVNAQGIAGSGKVMPVTEPALIIDNLDAVKIGDEVQLSWKAGVLVGDKWAFTIQKSEDNNSFTDIATVDARSAKNLQGYAWTDKNADAKSVLFYRVEARSTDGNKAASAAAAVKITGKPVFAVQPTLFDNTIQVTVQADKLPATYTITDITGRMRLTNGVINAVGQKVTLSNLSSGTYALSVTNKDGKSSVQLIMKK
jgi:hypothetical protein